MIPCHVCGKDASNHWTLGLTPSSDSLKTGLCAEHDSQEHRSAAAKAWEHHMRHEISRTIDLQARGQGAAASYVLTIFYSGGGTEQVKCATHAIFEDMALQVTTPDGNIRCYLLRYIKSFEISPR